MQSNLEIKKLGPSKLKLISFLALSLVMTIALYRAWRAGEMNPSGMYLFAVASLVFIVQLIPGSNYLLLDADGFETKTLFRSARHKWSEIEKFGTWKSGFKCSVGYNYSKTYARSGVQKLGKGICPWEVFLTDTYGQSADDLSQLLNSYLSNYSSSKI